MIDMFGFQRTSPTAMSFSIPPGRDILDGSRKMWSGGTYHVEFLSKEAADEHEGLLTANAMKGNPVMLRRIPGGAIPPFPVDTILVMVEVNPSEPHGNWEGKPIRIVAEITETMFTMVGLGGGKSS